MYINELTFKITTEAASHSFEVDDLIATTILTHISIPLFKKTTPNSKLGVAGRI